MDDLKVYYDEKEDILYIAKEGEEEEIVEISPGINLEMDKNRNLIGIEIFNASSLLKDVLNPLKKKLQLT